MANEIFVAVGIGIWYNRVNITYLERTMDIGARIKQARLEAGLSQRQLCGEVITRNMLSLIESGRARPSMDTLRYFAGVLGKPMGYFLEEQAVTSPNQQVMEAAENALKSGDFSGVLEILKDYKEGDGLFDGRKNAVQAMACTALAQQAHAQGKPGYALSLLEQADEAAGPSRERVLLRYEIRPDRAKELCQQLPPITQELLLRAQGALESGKAGVAAQYLDACEERSGRWFLLRGRAHIAAGQFQAAVGCLKRVESEFPQVCYPLLERCYKEQGDFQKAYEYACKRRGE